MRIESAAEVRGTPPPPVSRPRAELESSPREAEPNDESSPGKHHTRDSTDASSTDAFAESLFEESDFPGCHAIPMSREESVEYEGQLEYWSAAAETAWVVSAPTSAAHEQPGSHLPALAAVIAAVRGGHIRCYGTMDLLLPDETGGDDDQIMQADQTLYLHPERAKLLSDAMRIGRDTLPDVVLEADHTTDVRRKKLALYESWGFPEVWVDVPEAGYSVKRATGLWPGLRIHLLENGAYRESPESKAFPGWTAAEIHQALNEAVLFPETHRVLNRVGKALGDQEGTGPDDTLWLKKQREDARVEGRIEGERRLITRLAKMRFDGNTAGHLLPLLRRIGDSANLAEAANLVYDSETGTELIGRIKKLAARAGSASFGG